jgi:predicted porin
MKKTLVALAALAATASFAQSSVTLSGNLDFAYSNTTGSAVIYNGNTVATTTGTSSTSVINIIAVEDLGGGMKATAKFGLDPRSLANDGLGVSFDQNSGTAMKSTNTGLNRDEVFVGVSGNFGNVRLGSPNSISLGAHSTASPLGTGIGSGYANISGNGALGAVTTRFNRSVRYDSPIMSGITVSALYAPGDDTVSTTAITALSIPNNRNVTEVGVSYNNGPLNVAVANVSQAAQTNAAGYYVSTTAVNFGKSSSNLLSANYNFGSTTVYVGFMNGDSITGATTPSTIKSNRIAVKQNFGAVDVILQAQDLTTTTGSTDTKATVSGLRVDYALSKTAAVYLGYQKVDTGTAYVSTSTAAAQLSGDNTTVSVGLRKSF